MTHELEPIDRSPARFSGRVAIVIGGTSGIGLATAVRLTAEGATVVIAARDTEDGRRATSVVGGATTFAPVDVRDRAQVDARRRHRGSAVAASTCSSTAPVRSWSRR